MLCEYGQEPTLPNDPSPSDEAFYQCRLHLYRLAHDFTSSNSLGLAFDSEASQGDVESERRLSEQAVHMRDHTLKVELFGWMYWFILADSAVVVYSPFCASVDAPLDRRADQRHCAGQLVLQTAASAVRVDGGDARGPFSDLCRQG